MAQSYGATSDISSRARANAQDKAQDIRSQVEDAAQGALDSAAKVAGAVEKQAETAYVATKKFVEEQPFVALAGVAVLGIALGALWKLSPSRPSSQAADVIDRLANAVGPHYEALRRRW
jgi:ElaB/YqjD/DUF883 family membrane-anchored ribosome-binding protein